MVYGVSVVLQLLPGMRCFIFLEARHGLSHRHRPRGRRGVRLGVVICDKGVRGWRGKRGCDSMRVRAGCVRGGFIATVHVDAVVCAWGW